MPHYFFDIHVNGVQRDEEGVDCADFDTARTEAMRSLSEIGRWAIPTDDDSQALAVFVRDESATIVYIATLTFAGLRIDETSPVIRSVA